MKIPNQIFQNLQPYYSEGLNPLLQIELKGGINLDKLFKILQNDNKILCNIIKADISFSGKESFGTLLLFLLGTSQDYENTIAQFKNHKIQNKLVGYA